LSDCSGRQRQHAWRTGARAVGRSLSALRSSGRDVDGPRYAVVESEIALGTNPSVAVADATRNPVALERHSTSTNAREGGTIPRSAAARSATAWLVTRATANLARRLSLGAQLCASARSAGDADAGHALAAQSAALRSSSAALGVSLWCLGVETRLPRTSGHPGKEVESQ